MKHFRSILLVSAFVCSTIQISHASDDESDTAQQNPNPGHMFTMGVEAETSVFKVRPREGNETYKMTIFKSPDSVPFLWAFTSDTTDETIRNSSSQPRWMNTECKTLGGLSPQQMLGTVEQINNLWKKLSTLCPEDGTAVEIKESNLKSALLPIVWSKIEVEYDSVLISRPNKRDYQIAGLVYPQLTYGMPLESVEHLFTHMHERLRGTRHSLETLWDIETPQAPNDLPSPKVEKAVQDPVSATPRKVDVAALTLQRFMKKSRDPKPPLQAKAKVRASTYEVRKLPSSHAKGLSLLFAYYVYCLFSENIPCDTDEPGPKPELGIMSRVSFSEMYDSLDDPNKAQFRMIIENYFKDMFQNKVVPYITVETEEQLAEYKRITLEVWYQSIIDQGKRQLVKTQGGAQKSKDLLYPPPACNTPDNPYGMGAFPLQQDSHTLVEVRAYASRDLTRQNIITLDNFVPFMQGEIKWFFAEINHKGDPK